jgi:hypothetical protein
VASVVASGHFLYVLNFLESASRGWRQHLGHVLLEFQIPLVAASFQPIIKHAGNFATT